MKKFIPYILITFMISMFFLTPIADQNIALAQEAQEEKTWVGEEWQRIKDDFGFNAWRAVGRKVYNDPTLIIPGQAIGYAIADTMGWGDWGSIADATFGRMLSWISNFTWYASAKIFTMSGYLLDYAVDFSVKDFKQNIEHIGVIDQGYKIILNVANMLFIFVLLYIAIKTILGMGGDTKKLLTSVIVVALLINFSLFMTKVIIDASNIVAMGFYDAVRTEVGKTQVEGDATPEKLISIGSVSTAMMAGLKLQTMQPTADSDYTKEDPSKGLTHFNIAMNQFGGSALFLVSAFVFFSGAFLFIIRFIALLFYMLFSPVAFLGMISPELKEHSSKWWKGLQSQAIFAPVFLFIAYLISSIVNSGKLWEIVGGNQSSTFFEAFSSPNPKAFPIIMNYVILIALMVGGLIAAKKLASEGSAGVVGYADKFRGWMQGVAGRNTLGRAAYLANKSEAFNKLAAMSPTIGGFAKTQLNKIAEAEFGGTKGGFAKQLKERIKQKREIADSIAKSKTKEVDELIRREQSLKDEDVAQKADLNNEVLKSQIKVDDIENENKIYSDLMKNVEELNKEYQRLFAISSLSMSPNDINATLKAEQKLNQETTRLGNERLRLTGRGVNVARYEAELENAKMDIDRAMANLEHHERDAKKIEDKLKNLSGIREGIRNKMKVEYMKKLPFASWGKSFAFLDEIFPSYPEAADEIRKGKSREEREVAELVRKLVEEEKAKTS